MIKKSLENKGKRKAAADELGISERTLYRKSNNSICSLFKKIARGFKHKMNIFDKVVARWRSKKQKMKLIKFILSIIIFINSCSVYILQDRQN
jgi:hypothetical protein